MTIFGGHLLSFFSDMEGQEAEPCGVAAQVEEWHLEPDGIWIIVELVGAVLRPSGET